MITYVMCHVVMAVLWLADKLGIIDLQNETKEPAPADVGRGRPMVVNIYVTGDDPEELARQVSAHLGIQIASDN